MRLDKFISNLGYGSRREVGYFIKGSSIQVNGQIIREKDCEIQVGDKIGIGEEEIEYKEFLYVLLYKPAGYVSSNKSEAGYPSYLTLLEDCPYAPLLHPVGRLDVDTTGLLLLTNDGNFTHSIINPKKEIFKKYKVMVKEKLSQNDILKLKTGVIIDEDYTTKPAIVEQIDDTHIYLSISEGKFHQIKKMLESIGNEVTALCRERIGEFSLGNLKEGEWRYI